MITSALLIINRQILNTDAFNSTEIIYLIVETLDLSHMKTFVRRADV